MLYAVIFRGFVRASALPVLSIVALSAGLAKAQDSPHPERGSLGVNLIVKVTDASNTGLVADVALQRPGMLDRTSSTDNKGDCFFHSVRPGEYVLAVSIRGQELQREQLVLSPNEVFHSELMRLPISGRETGSQVSAMDLGIPHGAKKNYTTGIANTHTRKWTQAEANFRESIEKCPTYIRAFNALGVVLVMQERFAEAEMAFRKATALDDRFGEAHLNLGNLLFREHREPEAIDELRKVIGTEPTNLEALGILGEAYLSVQSDEGATQLLGYVDARKIPHNPLLHFRLAQQLEGHQRREIAVEEFRRYVTEAPAAAYSEDARHEIDRLTNSKLESHFRKGP